MTNPGTRRSSRLYRDPVDKKIGGVASGVARYFDIDTTLMRAVWAASILVGGFGLFLYLILWFILDENPELLASLQRPAPAEPSNPSGSSQFAPPPAGESDGAEALEETETLEASNPSGSSQFAPQTAGESDGAEALEETETAEAVDEAEDSNPSSS